MSTENNNPPKENVAKRSNELLGFDKNGELEYIGYCGVAINSILKMLQIKVDGKEDAIESSFNNEFIKNKNILCITAIKKTNDIVLVFTKEDTCLKVWETIEKIKREKLNFISNKDISDKIFKERFLPRFLKSNKTGDDSSRFINIIIDATINPILIDAFDEETENDEISINELEPVYEKEASVIDLPEIHETNDTLTNNENIREPPAKKAKMVTFSENITSSGFESSSIAKTKIIPSSSFELIQFDNMGLSYAKLSIFVSNNRNLCYEYFNNNKKSNYFACDGCKKQKKTTKAIFSNGNKEVDVEETPHICEPRIYKPYIREKNIIKKGGFDVKIKLQRGSQTEVLIIYDDAELELCRIFTYEKRTKKYICTKCTKIKMFAFLHEPLSEEVYVQLGYGEHDCEPLKYSELDSKKYISYWEIPANNGNSSSSTGNDSIQRASMTPQMPVLPKDQSVKIAFKQPSSIARIPLLPTIKIEKEVPIPTKTIEFLPISFNLFHEKTDTNEILFEAKNNNLELGASTIENNDNNKISYLVMKEDKNVPAATQSVSSLTEITNSNKNFDGTSTPIEKDLFWNFMENPIVDKSKEKLVDKIAEKTNTLADPPNFVFYSKSKLALLEKRKYANLLPVISNSQIGSPNCTFYSKRKNDSQSKCDNIDLVNLQRPGYGQKDQPNSSDSLSGSRDADVENPHDVSINKNQNYSNRESPQPIDYDFYGQNDFELNHISNEAENNLFEKCDTNIEKNNETLNVPNQIHSSNASMLNVCGSNQSYGRCSPPKNFPASSVNPPIISKNGLPSIIPRSNIRILKPLLKKTSSSEKSKKPTYVIKILNSNFKPAASINKPLTYLNKIINAPNDNEVTSTKLLPNYNACSAKSDEAAVDFPSNQPIIVLKNILPNKTPKNFLCASLFHELNNLATTNLTENEIIQANQFSHDRLERNIQNDINSDYHPSSAAIWNSNHDDHKNNTPHTKSKENSQHSILYQETIKNVQKLNNNLIESSQFLHKNISEEISSISDETFSLPASSENTMQPFVASTISNQENSDQETTDLDNSFLAATIDNNKNKEEILKIQFVHISNFGDNNLPSSSNSSKKLSSPPQSFSIKFNMENLETKKDEPPNYKVVKNPSNHATQSPQFNSGAENNFHEKPRNQPTNIFPVNFGPTIEEPEEFFSIQILEKPKSIKPLTQLQTFPRPNLPPKLLNNQILKFSFIKNSSNGQRELHASCELNPKNYYIFIFHSQTKIYRCGQCWNKGRLVSAKVCKDLKDNTKISLHIFGKHICKPFTHL